MRKILDKAISTILSADLRQFLSGRIRSDIGGKHMYIVVGLGNPGAQYANTRHNVGFDALERLASIQNIPIRSVRHKAMIGDGLIEGERVLLCKPQTYMNLSGEAVHDLMRFYKISTESLIVLYDDVDLPIGRIRIRANGSAGTHNGMRSIVARMGTQDFTRIRIGVGRPPEGWDLADHVLSRVPVHEQKNVQEAVERSVLAVSDIILHGIDFAMNRHNN